MVADQCARARRRPPYAAVAALRSGIAAIASGHPCPVHLASQAVAMAAEDWTQASLTVVVVGASGDLAKKKIFPALFALYYENLLPDVSAHLQRVEPGASPARPAALKRQAFAYTCTLRCCLADGCCCLLLLLPVPGLPNIWLRTEQDERHRVQEAHR